MAASTTDVKRPFKITPSVQEYLGYPVAAGEKIPAGVGVNINATGFAVNATDSATDLAFAGVSREAIDNSAGTDGDLNIEIDIGGIRFFTCSTTAAVTDHGQQAMVADNDNYNLAAVLTNDISMGRIVLVDVDANGSWIKIGDLS